MKSGMLALAWLTAQAASAASMPAAAPPDSILRNGRILVFSGPERHGNPNVLTLDVGTSRLTQGPSALSALVQIERWTGAVSPVHAFTPPLLAAG